jgi:chorismate-pyruvate lyase
MICHASLSERLPAGLGAGTIAEALQRHAAMESEVRTSPQGASITAALLALNAELLHHDSATLALERWCRAHGLPSRARVTAQLLRRGNAEPTADQRRRLEVGTAEAVRYRRVWLSCGGRVLSEAENWYVPGRLTPEMNQLLQRTDTPFGRAVAALRFRRRVLAADLLWTPWAGGGKARGAAWVPPYVLQHRALLLGADGAPLSEVVETYTREALFLPDVLP